MLHDSGWSSPRLGCFSPEKETRYPFYGDWVRPRAGLDGCGNSRPPLEYDPRDVQPVGSRYTM